jgi:hypothetical protein
MPFGGYRQSGIGRENGEYALENYLQVSAKTSVTREKSSSILMQVVVFNRSRPSVSTFLCRDRIALNCALLYSVLSYNLFVYLAFVIKKRCLSKCILSRLYLPDCLKRDQCPNGGKNHASPVNLPHSLTLQAQIFKLRLCYKRLSCRSSFASLLLRFLITFFFPSTLPLRHERLAFYTTTLNDDRRVTLSLVNLLSNQDQHLTFALLLLFFLDDRLEWQRI